MFVENIQPRANVKIIARERGKKMNNLCRESHNVWVNFGREYLAKVIAPLAGFAGHVNDSVVRSMGLGIGSVSQGIDIATAEPTLDTDYPGQNIFDDGDVTTPYLERPIKVSGTAGVGVSSGIWMKDVTAPPNFIGSPATTVEFVTLFAGTDGHLGGAYPSLPLSEIGLFLSSEQPSLTSEQVYDYSTAPAYINAGTRPKLVAYNNFDTISKTNAVTFEVHWEIRF